MFSCEICEIFKNTYFEEHVRKTVSNNTYFQPILILHQFYRHNTSPEHKLLQEILEILVFQVEAKITKKKYGLSQSFKLKAYYFLSTFFYVTKHLNVPHPENNESLHYKKCTTKCVYRVFGCTKYRILKSSHQTAKVAKTDTNSIGFFL